MSGEDPTSGRPRIGLCMIVRDEESVVERCIDSVRGLISAWTICDTGSRDSTPELVEHLLADLPGTLHHRRWKNFGHNRSELMELARGSAEYLLLVDADMTIEQRAALPPLSADAYLIAHAGSLAYRVHRLVRGACSWRYEGSTHEYLTCDEPYSSEPLAALLVHHHADGGSRADKLERDRRLLEAELEADPDRERSTFYLAQTHRDLDQPERALELYRRRLCQGGWNEELYYAALQAGLLLERLGRSDEAVRELLKAEHLRPARAEHLYQLARICRGRGDHLAAYRFARRGLERPLPEDILFVDRDAYEWGLLFELSIAAWWSGAWEEALEAGNQLLANASLPAWLKPNVEENLALSRLPRDAHERPAGRSSRVSGIESLIPGTRMGEVYLDVEPDWPRFNPSIARAEDGGFRMTVRTASYEIREREYRSLGEAGTIETINYLAELDRDLGLCSVEPLLDATGVGASPEATIIGYEDMRLIEVGDHWLALATVADRPPEGLLRMALLHLDGNVIGRRQDLSGPIPNRPERNWAPFVVDGELLLVYSFSPTIIFRCQPGDGGLTRAVDAPAPASTRGLRGGSQGLEVTAGHLFCVHEVAVGAQGRRYIHRFALLDHDLRLARLSPGFQFAGEPLEFCVGLARRDDEFVLSFGVGDRAAGIALCPESSVMASLQQLPRD